jgi:hypothetical protein
MRAELRGSTAIQSLSNKCWKASFDTAARGAENTRPLRVEVEIETELNGRWVTGSEVANKSA